MYIYNHYYIYLYIHVITILRTIVNVAICVRVCRVRDGCLRASTNSLYHSMFKAHVLRSPPAYIAFPVAGLRETN